MDSFIVDLELGLQIGVDHLSNSGGSVWEVYDFCFLVLSEHMLLQ